MHTWGEENVDWQGIDEAAYFIGRGLRKWVRMDVRDYKEKYGTVRVYCGFGWYGLHTAVMPGYVWYPKWWPVRLDMMLTNTFLFQWFNKLVVIPIQKRAYVWFYWKAVEKWPHLRHEILSMADYGQLFEGNIPGYKHSDYWRTV